MSKKIVIVHHSGYGHTTKVAEAVAAGSGGTLLLIDAEGNLPEGGWERLAAADAKRGVLKLVASPDGRDGAVRLNADAAMYVGLFDGAERAALDLDPKRLAYVHVARGSVNVNGQALQAGDAAKFDGESRLELSDGQGAEVIVFDLAR